MANAIRCGNPACKGIIPLNLAQPDGRIQCPHCKLCFLLKPSSISKPQEAPTSFPLAVQNRYSKKKKTIGITSAQFTLLAFAVFLLAATATGIWLFGIPILKETLKEEGISPNNIQKLQTAWFSIEDPPGYAKSPQLAIQLKTQLSFKGPKGDILAFYYKDHKTTNPEPEEEFVELKSRLSLLLPQNLEYQEKGEKVILSGVPFREWEIAGANGQGEKWTGSCLSGVFHGIHFLFIRLANANESAEVLNGWKEFASRFTIDPDSRKNWKATSGKSKEFTPKGTSLAISYLHGVWEPMTLGEDESWIAGKFLGKNPDETGNFANQRGTFFLVTDKEANLEAQWKDPAKTIFRALQEAQSEDRKLTPADGDFPLPNKSLAELQFSRKTYSLEQPDTNKKLVDLIYVKSEKGGAIFICEGPWKARAFWAAQNWVTARTLNFK